MNKMKLVSIFILLSGVVFMANCSKKSNSNKQVTAEKAKFHRHLACRE